MKRFLITVMVFGLVVGSLSTAGAKKSPRRVERTVSASYGLYPAPVTGCNEPLGPWVCFTVEARSTEAFFTAKVTDAHGQPVYVAVGSSPGTDAWTFCGETTQPIRINPGSSLEFYVGLTNIGLPTLDCPVHRLKTTGTISVTLSNLP